MMKSKILTIFVFVFTMLGLSSCDKDTTEGLTRITYYPTLEMSGDKAVIISVGDTYVDAGCYAELQGEDVTNDVVVVSTVDESTAGIYSVTYTITNSDGFSVTKSRTVYVADPTPSIISTGIHTTATGTHRINHNSDDARTDFSGYSIVILQIEPGVFYISDYLGGYYEQRAGYGSNYAMTGTFELNADFTITPLSSNVAGWGDSMDGMSASSVDSVTGQISYTLSYAGFLTFNIIIN